MSPWWDESSALTKDDLEARLHEALSKAECSNYPADRFSGKGITICGGGIVYFTNAWVLIRNLRDLGCQLPIELWYTGKAEVDQIMCGLVRPYDVQCVDGYSACQSGCDWLSGWPLKPLAILNSKFAEVLAIDADNVAVRDPTFLFDTREYNDTGAIFWPDRGSTPRDAEIWRLLRLPPTDEREFESGQLVINKHKCWAEINLAMWFNRHSSVFYKYLHGDKDTFRFAFKLTGKAYSRPSQPLEELTIPGAGNWGVMCQHSFDGERLFQHRSFPKWSLHGENIRVAGFIHELSCLRYIKELSSLWDGRILSNSSAVVQQDFIHYQQYAEELISTRFLLIVIPRYLQLRLPDLPLRDPFVVSDGQRPSVCKELQFLPNGKLGIGVCNHFWGWTILPTGQLELHGDRGTAFCFIREREDFWIGTQPGTDQRHQLRALNTVYPFCTHSRLGDRAIIGEVSSGQQETLAVINSAKGLGDSILGIYACVGAVRQGMRITYYTDHAEWFTLVSEPNLTISSAAPPIRSVDLNFDYPASLRYSIDKADWYLRQITSTGTPAPPSGIPTQPALRRVDFLKYVVLAPFCAWRGREWPSYHWTRLAHCLSDQGYEIVAIGVQNDDNRMAEIFSKTNAFWACGKPVDWVVDLILGAEAVVGNDSAIPHLSGLFKIPTIAVHAQLPARYLWSHAQVQSLMPSTKCAGCRWQASNGYRESCEAACSALATISPERVAEDLQLLLSHLT